MPAITRDDLDALVEGFEDNFSLAPEVLAKLKSDFTWEKLEGQDFDDVMMMAHVALMATMGLTEVSRHEQPDGSTIVSINRPGDEQTRLMIEAFARGHW